MQIVLDVVEEKVKNILLQFSKEFAKNGNPQVTLRFTGGWVRDKLLNRPSHDIDVAIDKSTGEQFATDLHAYLTKLGLDEISVHKISCNPDKSKHLETATTRICGLDVDFVNLRSEEYVSNSRIPKTQFGTPVQDALRRDATLNALFYNLTTEQIEDFTNRGLQDLKDHVLRTPLDPKVTFSDDPLRVLRLLRFVGQLGFDLAPETRPAMDGKFVGKLLNEKISSERVGTEMTKLMESDNAFKAMQTLIDLDLGPYVFSTLAKDTKKRDQSVHTEELKRHLSVFSSLPNIQQQVLALPKHEKCVIWLSVLLQSLSMEAKAKEDSPVVHVLKNSLKMSNNVKDAVVAVLKSREAFDALLESGNSRRDLGMYVRNTGAIWPLTILFHTERLAEQNEPVTKATNIKTEIENEHLETAYSLKPLVNGKQIAQALNRKPGPWMTSVVRKTIEHQLANPKCTAEDLLQYVVESEQESKE